MNAQRTIRPALASDLAAIWAIEQASFENPWPRSIYAEELERETAVLEVAEEGDGGVLGVSCTWQFADEAHLLRIATDPHHRHRGIGGDLLSAVLDRARPGQSRRRAADRCGLGSQCTASGASRKNRAGNPRREQRDSHTLSGCFQRAAFWLAREFEEYRCRAEKEVGMNGACPARWQWLWGC